MKNKKIIKKIRVFAADVARKTGILVKKADKKAGETVQALQKKWKQSAPKREQYKKDIKKAAKKAGAKGSELLSDGLKIGSDVVHVIKKDISEMRGRKSNKNK